MYSILRNYLETKNVQRLAKQIFSKNGITKQSDSQGSLWNSFGNKENYPRSACGERGKTVENLWSKGNEYNLYASQIQEIRHVIKGKKGFLFS